MIDGKRDKQFYEQSVDNIKPIRSHRLGTTRINPPPMARRCCQSAPGMANRSLDAGGGSAPPGPQAAAGQRAAAARARGTFYLVT